MEKIRLGIIGLGNMGGPVSKLVAIENQCPEIELKAVCDISQERREWAAKTYEGSDIAIFADRMPPSTFQGFDSEHMTKDILIENLTLNGKPVTTLEKARVQIMDYAENIVIR